METQFRFLQLNFPIKHFFFSTIARQHVKPAEPMRIVQAPVEPPVKQMSLPADNIVKPRSASPASRAPAGLSVAPAKTARQPSPLARAPAGPSNPFGDDDEEDVAGSLNKKNPFGDPDDDPDYDDSLNPFS